MVTLGGEVGHVLDDDDPVPGADPVEFDVRDPLTFEDRFELRGCRRLDVDMRRHNAPPWRVRVERHDHGDEQAPSHGNATRPVPDNGARLSAQEQRAPGWFVYLWEKLASRQIVDVEFLREHLDPPRWVIDYLEAPILGDGIIEVDTRMETLRRIYALTRAEAGPPAGHDRGQWALETLGEVRGLAASQI